MTSCATTEAILARARSWPSLAVILDYDGTLVPIADHPDQAEPNSDLRQLVESLGRFSQLKLAIVSGRPIRELRRWFVGQELLLVGVHGAEFELPDGRKILLPGLERLNRVLRPLVKHAECRLSRYPNVFLEDKGCALALHYRQASEATSALAVRTFRSLAAPWSATGGFKWTYGKKVLELRPAAASKGQAVEFLLNYWRQKTSWTIYAGDDETDEDAFNALLPAGWPILVSEVDRASNARLRVRSPDQIVSLLKEIGHFLEGADKTIA